MNAIQMLRVCVAWLAALWLGASAFADDSDPVVHVYVVRRALDGQPITSIGRFAHSGLLLKTRGGKFFVLEYMSDSKAHLTPSEPHGEKVNQAKKIAIIQTKGWSKEGVKEFEWERQLQGKPLGGAKSAEALQQTMQQLMKPYSVFKEEYCHSAQERLRKELGLLD